ncbi:MAG TPA: hypothetical protein VFM23_05505 [Gemmatimonadales bacterium]|nr:hypothetical protein [Gemmatimonadales bacterium]
MRTRSSTQVTVALVAVVAACSHTEPFRPGQGGANEPLFPGSPAQLTFNPGEDLVPAWLPDGSAFIYTAERGDRADRDRCFATMPARGGSITRYACRTQVADDSINVFDEAAIRGDSIVYVRASTERFLQGLGPDRLELVIAPLSDLNAGRLIQTLGFTTPWGTTYDAVSHVTRLDANRIAFIGERVTYPRGCSSCVPDTVRTGLEIVIADISGATPAYTRMPDGDNPASLTAAANGDTIYFSLQSDSHVLRRTLSTAQTDTLLDLIAGPVIDLTVSSGRVSAVAGGSLYLVDGAAVTELGDPSWLFERPVLSPDGTRLIVTARRTGPTADLWLFELP